MAKPVDYFDLAQRSSRAEFVNACPFYFLVGKQLLDRPHERHRTGVMDVYDQSQDNTGATKTVEFDEESGSAETLVLAVRKVQENFPSMITVGRTANNDLCIADVNVSRFHAFFRVHPDRVEISDAGSANGTQVGALRLVAKGTPKIVNSGERVAFGHLEFRLFDAGTTWDRLRQGDE